MNRRGEVDDSSRELSVPSLSTLLAAVAVALVAIAMAAFVSGELLLAGFLMLLTSFVIYLRETRT